MDASTRRLPRAWAWLRAAGMSSVVLVGAACQPDLPTAPNLGFLKVDVVTTGDDRDADGYSITLDGGRTSTMASSVTTQSFYLPSGTHTVAIANVAPNCTVEGTTTRQAEVTRGQIVTVEFTIACVGTGVTIATTTTGPDIPRSFHVTVDAQPSLSMEVSGTLTVGRLSPGTHAVKLTVPEHCTVEGANPLSVVVADKGYAPAGFTVVCSPAIRREKIAYVVIGNMFAPAVETITLDGSRVDRLDARGYSVTWKRDGRQLAVSDAVCGFDYYYYYDNTGWSCSGAVYLTDPELGTSSKLAGSEGGLRPAWSPVRDELVFDREGQILGTAGRVSQLYLLDAGASAAQVIFLADSRTMVAPTWAPDGERIAYGCTPQAKNPDLCVVNRDGTGYRRLTADPRVEKDPAWSPDGKTIAFTYIWDGGASSGDVALLDVASGTITSLGAGRDPAWSPDGSRIVFVGSDGLFVMNADGSNRRRLTTGNHEAPAWRPTR